jgi:hypothetical protein
MPHALDTAALARHFQDVLDSAALIAGGYVAGTRLSSLDRAHHQQLSVLVESCAAFERLYRSVAQVVPRYSPTAPGPVGSPPARGKPRDPEAMAAREAAAFLRRRGVYRCLLSDSPPDAETLAREYLQAAERPLVQKRHLVPIDGLKLAEGVVVEFGPARLLRLTKAAWDAFFESDLYPVPDTGVLSKLGVLEVFQDNQEWHSGPVISFAPPPSRVDRIAEPWITHLCLYGGRAVRPCALYSKSETLLAAYPVERVQLQDPSVIEQYYEEDGPPDLIPIYDLTVGSPDELRDFVIEMEGGRERAGATSPRLETALHWFRRSADYLHHDPDRDAYEDFIADTFTALEAVLLRPDEKPRRPKGERIANRAAAILSSTDGEIPELQKRIGEAYSFRNAIVHGDVRPKKTDLATYAEFLGIAVRRILAAALRLGGDHGPLIAAEHDSGVRDRVRPLAKHPA